MLPHPQWRRSAAVALAALLALSCPPPVACMRAWVYTLVSADHGGELLLPHFLHHYHQLGVTYRRFLILVHHAPGRSPRKGLELIAGICQGYSVECRLWEGPFSMEAHMEHQLRMLQDFVHDPYDWIVTADVDELQEWPASIKEAVEDIQATGASYINAFLVDRVAPGGEIVPVSPAVAVDPRSPRDSLFAQFPLRCGGVKREWDFKVAAFRNYLRAGRSNLHIVAADAARAYYGPCPPGQPCPRGRTINLDKDFFNLTPYGQHEDQYKYLGTPRGAKPGLHAGLFQAKEFVEYQIAGHHFKWHAGVVHSMRDRLERFSGDCRLGVQEDACTPLLPRWREWAGAYAALVETGRVNLTGMGCEAPTPGEDVDVDTTYPGMAWEQFEDSLHVVSKVRSAVRGDSQTRQAAKLAAGKAGGE